MDKMENPEIKKIQELLEIFWDTNRNTLFNMSHVADYLYTMGCRLLPKNAEPDPDELAALQDLQKLAENLKEKTDYFIDVNRELETRNRILQGQVDMVKLIFGGPANGNN